MVAQCLENLLKSISFIKTTHAVYRGVKCLWKIIILEELHLNGELNINILPPDDLIQNSRMSHITNLFKCL